MSFLDSIAGRYIRQAVDYIETEERGRILSAAQQGADLVPDFARKYVSRLDDLAPSVLGTLRWVVKTYDVPKMAQPVIRDVVADLQRGTGELAEVARQYPEWLADHLRRLLNLTILRLSRTEGG